MKRCLLVTKTIVVGGILFLVPFAVALFVIGKVFKLAVMVVVPLADVLPFQSLIGLKTPWLLAVLLLLAVCFAAGLLARTSLAGRLVNWLETAVLSSLPAYSFMKGVGEEFSGSEPSDHHESVLVRLDEGHVLGFLVEHLDSGHSVVFLPGAPKPWDGGVMIVDDDRVTLLTPSSKAAVTCLRKLGAGAGQLVEGKLGSKH
ncbi:MAG: DUF502 domain-containing protein [Victivallales bacterium]|jgi:uncharacterized membrane protein|nr:DUF502 domain-containing protein [Victivallales bacterium]